MLRLLACLALAAPVSRAAVEKSPLPPAIPELAIPAMPQAALPATQAAAPTEAPLAAAALPELSRQAAASAAPAADAAPSESVIQGQRGWDGAAAATAGEAAASPRPRYEKLSTALEQHLQAKGYRRALAAMVFARSKHTGKRKDGLTPEFQHQVEIALFITTLKDVRHEELALTAAMLHDVVEDCPEVSREDIRRRFGADVEDVVWRLTKTYRGRHKPYPEYFAAIAEDPTASLVKGADRVNNLQTMIGAFSLPKQREYAEEARRWFLPMLKTARRRFPDQEGAYFNVEQRLKSQLELIDAMLTQADRAQPLPR